MTAIDDDYGLNLLCKEIGRMLGLLFLFYTYTYILYILSATLAYNFSISFSIATETTFIHTTRLNFLDELLNVYLRFSVYFTQF